jgi:hypothetical protein
MRLAAHEIFSAHEKALEINKINAKENVVSVILTDAKWIGHIRGIAACQGINKNMPLNYDEHIPNSMMRLTDDLRFTLAEPVTEWIEQECAGGSILRFEDDQFLLSFTDKTDATMFNIRFAC